MTTNHRYAAIVATVALASSSTAFAHGTASGPEAGPNERVIEFPDTATYRTLVVDLHTHTVFSDGHVWPRTRIGEALRDGLDAIAITDHLEWQPHLVDIPHLDRNRSYTEAASALGESDLIVIRGSEITRSPPANHMNAVFIEDANALYRAPAEVADPFDPVDYYTRSGEWPAQQAVQAANDQGAFVFWNHPFSDPTDPDGIARIPQFHEANARNGLLHGIEIANGATYSEEAFQIALDHDLALMGVSDVHNLIDWDYKPHEGGHRPVTLVFAEARTADAIKEALFAKRTVVWFRNLLLGRPAQLQPLLDASMTIDGAEYRPGTQVASVTLTNHTDAHFLLKNTSDYTFQRSADIIGVPPHESVNVNVKPGARIASMVLEFEVLNALTAPKQPVTVRYELELQLEPGPQAQ